MTDETLDSDSLQQLTEADMDSNESGKMPYLKKQRRNEILAELRGKFQDGARFNSHTVLELYPEFRNYHRAFEFLSAAVQRDELRRVARGVFAFGLPSEAEVGDGADDEQRGRRSRLLKTRRIEIFSGLAAHFPHPKPFTYDDMLALFPEVGPRNNVYSIVQAAIERGDLNRLEDGKLTFTASFVPLPIKKGGDEIPIDQYMSIIEVVGKRYEKPKLYEIGDILRPADEFRAAIYGDKFDLRIPSELHPRCVVIDYLDEGNTNREAPPFDILICYLDSNLQAHVKTAGSWQFQYYDRSGG